MNKMYLGIHQKLSMPDFRIAIKKKHLSFLRGKKIIITLLFFLSSSLAFSQLLQDEQILYGTKAGEHMGEAVDITVVDGRAIAVIGSPEYDATNFTAHTGRVRVYELVNGTWSQLGGDIADANMLVDGLFGFSVSISEDGTRIAVGQPSEVGTTPEYGAAYVYEYNPQSNSWEEIGFFQELQIGDRGNELGYAVSLNTDGSRVAITARLHDNDDGTFGKVLIYEDINGVWTLIGDIYPNSSDSFERWGAAVVLNPAGDYLAASTTENITPPGANDGGQGITRIYHYNGSTWSQVGSDIMGKVENEASGASLDISDNGHVVVIGSLRGGQGITEIGDAKVYAFNGSAWNQVGADISGENQHDQFGISVSINGAGSVVAIGGSGSDNAATNAGHTKIFKYNLINGWEEIGEILGDANYDSLGTSVAITREASYIITGAIGEDDIGQNLGVAGKVKIYKTLIPPTVVTDAATGITYSTLTLQGEVTHGGEFDISRTEFVYSTTNTKPTIGGTDVTDTFLGLSGGGGVGPFSRSLTNLTPNTTFYYRAYSTNNGGTSYGDVMTATTAVLSPFLGYDEGDQYGYSVAINANGTRFIAGAINNDAGADNAGNARVYELVNGTWTQLGPSINGQAANDLSGFSVSMSDDGTRVAIGAPFSNDDWDDMGIVRIYQYNTTSNNWDQVGSDIIGEFSHDESGGAVSLNANGTRVAIGAKRNDGVAVNSAGHVRIYQESGGAWTQLGGDIDGEAAEDQSGFSVSLNDLGNYVAIGAPNNDGSGSNSGHVRVYRHIPGLDDWVQVGADINGQATDDQFGYSVSINDDGTIVAIGGRRHSPGGHIQVYEFSGGTWTQLGNDIEGETSGERFGFSVSISADGTYLIGGASNNSGDAGKARVFKYNSATSNWDQQGADIVGDATGDLLSFSASISGDANTVIVGAPNNDTNGSNSGQVKVVVNSINPTVITSVATEITLSTAKLGGNVLNEGQSMIERGVVYSSTNTNPTIGANDVTKNPNGTGLGTFSKVIADLSPFTTYYYRAYATDTNGTSYGSVMSFMTCQPLSFDGDLYGDAAGDEFGYSVAVSADGTRMIAGARNSDNGGTDSGHARVYELTNGVWTQLGNDINGSAAGDLWGSSVSISDDGTRIAVGSPSIAGSTGAVGIYQYNGSAWVQVGDTIEGEALGDSSGRSISLNADGTRIAIGASLNDVNGTKTDAGHVRVYGESGGTWTQLGVDIDGEAAGDQSGYSVGLNDAGDYLIVGGLNNDANGSNSGHARIYNYNGTSWVQVGADIDGQATNEQFGFSVSINSDGTIIAIGARRHDPAGIIQVYEFSGGTWTQLGSDIEGEITGEWFGYSVSISADGTYLVGGARRNNSDSGKARVFKYASAGDWTQVGSGIVGEAIVDFLSLSVSISGDGSTVVIGAPLNDTNGTDAGQVKIYTFPKTPIVNTLAANSFTSSTANIGGEVTNQGAFDVTERGVVYSFTNTTPTIGAAGVTKDTNGSGIGIFSKTITGLIQGTTYYYRAYATNNKGTSYGAVMTVTTAQHPGDDLLGEAAGGQFGISVAVSADGTRFIGGANLSDIVLDEGNARVFELTNGTWSQLGPNIDGAGFFNQWGTYVSMSGDGTRVAFGTPLNDDNGNNAGSIRTFDFDYNGNNWVQVGTNIEGESSGDQLGPMSFNYDGTRIAMGAPRNDGNGSNSGHVRIYQESGGTWTQLGGDIDGEVAGDQSGTSVSLNNAGDFVAIGAPSNDGAGNNAGHVRVFQLVGNSWQQVGNDIDAETDEGQFGTSVSINSDGTIVAVGVIRHDGPNGADSGLVQVYQYDEVNGWTKLGNNINGEAAGDWLGYSVSISADGTYLAAGAYENNSARGHTRVYKYEFGDWQQIIGDIDGNNPSDNLGYAVDISGDASTVVIGVPKDDTNGANAGKVKVISVSLASLEVTTDDPISIAANYAYLGGQVVHEGLSTVTERGIVYSTANPDPFIGDDNVTKVVNGSGLGSFTQKTTSLLAETIYYVKAYATNSQGTTYGEAKSFLSGLPIQIGQEITGSNNEDRYGQEIVLNSNGTVMVVGAPKNDTNDTDTGQVTVYELIGDEWMPKGNVLNGSATAEAIGYSVSINDAGTIIAIATSGSTTQGHVSIYEYNSTGNTWDLKGSSITVNSSASVKLNADGTKLVLAYDDTSNGDLSAISTYEFNGSNWVQYGNTINGLNTLQVDISNDGSRVITAYLSINSGNGNNSFVRVYEYNSGNDTWNQLGSDLEESIPDSDFGTSLSLNGDGTIATVTAYTSKQIYSYQESEGTWTQMGNAIISTETIESIQLDDTGNFLAVGYNGDAENKGYIRTYNFSANNWIQTYTSIYGKSADDLFGKSISISGDGNSFAAGAPSLLSTAKGTVRIFQTFGLPVVTTNPVALITGTTADLNGTVTSGAGSSITARGFVYSSSQTDLTLGANGVIQIESGTGLGSFQQTSTNMYFQTTYYVRAYATNANGTSYGETISFTTSYDEYNILHTTGVWEEGDKWSYTRSPIDTDNTLILEGRTGTLDTGNKTVGKLIVRPGAKLTIDSGKSLITTDSLNIEGDAILEIESGGSLIVNGTSTGQITYKRYLPEDNWYTISPPVQGQTFGSFVGNNNLDTGNGYVGLITYHNDGGGYNSTGWEFYDYPLNATDADIVLETGKGYAVRLPQAGTISFTGAAATSNVIIDTPVGATDFSYLIGNPYPAYLPANATTGRYTIIDENDSNMFEKSLWIWDNIQYDYISINDASTARYIAPGQGFFIRSNPAGTQSVSFLKNQRYHQTDVFNRTAQSTTTRPEIKLFVDDGVRKRDTDIFYIEGTTTGFDNGFDSTMFTILPDVSEIFTHMVSDSEGKDFDIQSLPDSNYEEMVVPIGISAVAGKELVFTATAVNFPEGIYVYLEDKETQTFTRLDEVGAEYRVTLTEDITTIGRFYLHTNTPDVLSVNSVDTQNVSIYLKDKDLLNVTGLFNQESQLKIYNIQGKEVFTTKFRATGLNEIRLPTLSSGIYIVRLETKSGKVNKKIVLH